jgi:hypothetical protein
MFAAHGLFHDWMDAEYPEDVGRLWAVPGDGSAITTPEAIDLVRIRISEYLDSQGG